MSSPARVSAAESTSAPFERRQEPLAEAPGGLELGAVEQVDDRISLEQRPDLAHALDVDQRAAVNADETVGVELRLELGERSAQQVRARADVQADVGVGGLDPVDLFYLDHPRVPDRGDEQAVGAARVGFGGRLGGAVGGRAPPARVVLEENPARREGRRPLPRELGRKEEEAPRCKANGATTGPAGSAT